MTQVVRKIARVVVLPRDSLRAQARVVIAENGRGVSVTFLMRRLRCGYERARKLLAESGGLRRR